MRRIRTNVFALFLPLLGCNDPGGGIPPTAPNPMHEAGAAPIAIADSGAPPAAIGGGGTLGGPSPSGGVTPNTPGLDAGPTSIDAGPSPGADAGNPGVVGGGTGGGFVRGPAPTAESAAKDGPHNVQSTTEGFRDGPNFAEATLWWPTDAEPPFAIVAVVPGWVSFEADIIEWGAFLASHGIVVLTIGTNSPATDLPPDRAAALIDALETLKAENTRAGGPLQGKLDLSRQATMGWSMGGGGTLMVAEQLPTLKATISMCGWNPGYDYGAIRTPALLFASEGDPLAGGQSQGFFDTIPSTTPKLLWEAPGGDHWLFNTPKNLGGVVGRYGLSWLKVYLEGDVRYAPFLKQTPAMQTDFRNNLQ